MSLASAINFSTEVIGIGISDQFSTGVKHLNWVMNIFANFQTNLKNGTVGIIRMVGEDESWKNLKSKLITPSLWNGSEKYSKKNSMAGNGVLTILM
jgi:hypothetical protein